MPVVYGQAQNDIYLCASVYLSSSFEIYTSHLCNTIAAIRHVHSSLAKPCMHELLQLYMVRT